MATTLKNVIVRVTTEDGAQIVGHGEKVPEDLDLSPAFLAALKVLLEVPAAPLSFPADYKDEVELKRYMIREALKYQGKISSARSEKDVLYPRRVWKLRVMNAQLYRLEDDKDEPERVFHELIKPAFVGIPCRSLADHVLIEGVPRRLELMGNGAIKLDDQILETIYTPKK